MMAVREVVCLLSLMCAVALGWSRLDPYMVPDGTHIEKNDTHISFFKPDGSSTHLLRANLPQKPWNGKSYAKNSARSEEEFQLNQEVPAYSGWISSSWSWGNSYTFISGQWNVPRQPTRNTGQIIFFFNSFEGLTDGGGSGSDILQPVLQFNNAVAGWTMSSWYGDSNGYVASTFVPVNVGDTITGIVTLTNDVWYVYGYVNGVLRTTLSIARGSFSNGVRQNTAQWALEVYNMDTCDMYPPINQLAVSNIYLEDNNAKVTPGWSTPSPNTGACNAAGIVSTPQSVTLNWQSGQFDLGTPVVAGRVGVDIVGNDLQSTTRASAILCASACDSTSGCNAWAWDNSGTQTCWLKSAAGSPSSNSARVSGRKAGRVGFDLVGSDLPGMPLALPTGSTAATCAAYCQGNGGCVAWAFDTAGGSSCWLKHAVPGTWSANGARTSGAKGALYIDHPGGDLSSSVLPNNADASSCATLCSQTGGCSGWSFALPIPGCDNFQRCWLKTGTTTKPNNNACRTSSG